MYMYSNRGFVTVFYVSTITIFVVVHHHRPFSSNINCMHRVKVGYM